MLPELRAPGDTDLLSAALVVLQPAAGFQAPRALLLTTPLSRGKCTFKGFYRGYAGLTRTRRGCIGFT